MATFTNVVVGGDIFTPWFGALPHYDQVDNGFSTPDDLKTLLSNVKADTDTFTPEHSSLPNNIGLLTGISLRCRTTFTFGLGIAWGVRWDFVDTRDNLTKATVGVRMITDFSPHNWPQEDVTGLTLPGDVVENFRIEMHGDGDWQDLATFAVLSEFEWDYTYDVYESRVYEVDMRLGYNPITEKTISTGSQTEKTISTGTQTEKTIQT